MSACFSGEATAPEPAFPDGNGGGLIAYSIRAAAATIRYLYHERGRHGTDPPDRSFAAEDACPAISPDGDKSIVFLSNRDGAQNIYVMDIDGSNVRQADRYYRAERATVVGGRRLRDPVHVKDYASYTELWKMNADGTGQVQINRKRVPGRTADAFPPTGDTILFMSNRDGNYEIYTMEINGSNQRRLTASPEQKIFPMWSPDGAKIAYSVNSPRNRSAVIHVMNSDGSEDTALTTAVGRSENPCWSPDGSKIVFQSERDGNFEIYSMNPDGSGQTRLTNSTGWDGWASWGVRQGDDPGDLINP